MRIALSAKWLWLTAMLLACGYAQGGYYEAVMEDDPVAYWRLDETTGTTAYDEVIGRVGAIINGVTLDQPSGLSNEPGNPSMNFNGSNGKVDAAYSPDLNPNVFSIECWARVLGGAGTYRSPLTARATIYNTTPTPNGSSGYIFYATPSDQWEFWNGRSTTSGWHVLASGEYVDYGVWTHLVGTYDGTTKRMYVDGELAASAAINYLPNTTSPLRIGAGATEGAGAYWFNGDIDEVAIYDTALSPEQVAHHYHAGVPEPCTMALLLGGLGALVARRRRK